MKIKTRVYHHMSKKMAYVEIDAYEIDNKNIPDRMERSEIISSFYEDPNTALQKLLNSKAFSDEEKNNLLFNLNNISRIPKDIRSLIKGE